MGRKGFYTAQNLSPLKPSHNCRSCMYACVRVCVSGYETCVRMFVINSAHALWGRDVKSRATNYPDGVTCCQSEYMAICRPIRCRHNCYRRGTRERKRKQCHFNHGCCAGSNTRSITMAETNFKETKVSGKVPGGPTKGAGSHRKTIIYPGVQ